MSEVLEDIARFAETQSEGALASILLLSSDGRRLFHGAAPHLPDFYNRAIDGILIDQGAGSCGTAAYLGDTVIVEDIRTHPYWEDYRNLAEQGGLRASWSEPIRSPEDRILGTFAMYYRQPRAPSGEEVELIRQAAQVAAVAIDRTWRQQDLRRAAVVFEQSPEGGMGTDADERILTVDRAFTQITGYEPQEALGATPRNPGPGAMGLTSSGPCGRRSRREAGVGRSGTAAGLGRCSLPGPPLPPCGTKMGP